MLVRTPDGITVDFGDMPKEEIKQKLLTRYPNLQRQAAGVAPVGGGLGAPQAPVAFSEVGGPRTPERTAPRGAEADQGIDPPRTVADLWGQAFGQDPPHPDAAKATLNAGVAGDVPYDPTDIMSIGRSITPEAPLTGNLTKDALNLPGWLFYRAIPNFLGAVQEKAPEVAGAIGGQGAAELTEYALTGTPELHGEGTARQFVKDVQRDFNLPKTRAQAKAVIKYLDEQGKGKEVPKVAAPPAEPPKPGQDHPEVKSILDKAAEARRQGQDRRAKALEDQAEIKRQEVTKTQPPLPPPPPPREGPPPELPKGRETTPDDVQKSQAKAEEARKKGDNNRAAAWDDIAKKQQEEIDRIKKAQEDTRKQQEEEVRRQEKANSEHTFNYFGETFKAISSHNAEDYLRKLDITPLLNSPLAKKLIPFVHKEIIKRLGSTPLHIIADAEVDRMPVDKKFRAFFSTNLADYHGTKGIYVRESVTKLKDYPEVILHEALHAVTVKALLENKALNKVVTTINDLVREHLKTTGEDYRWSYSTTNIKELMAYAFTNREFQDILAKIPVSERVRKTLKMPRLARSAWDAIVTSVRKVIGMPDNGHSVIEELMRPLQRAMVETEPKPSLDAMQRGASVDAPMEDQIHGAIQFFGPLQTAARAAVEATNRAIKPVTSRLSPSSQSKTTPHYGSQTRMAEVFRETLGGAARLNERDMARLENFQRAINQLPKGWGNDPAPPGYTGHTVLDVIRRIEGTRRTPLRDPELERTAQVTRKVFADIRSEFNRRPAYQGLSWRQNYFPGLWKDTPARQQFMSQYSGKLGSGKHLKEKKYPTIDDALKAGLEPKYDNPLDLVTQYNETMRRNLAKWDAYDIMRDAGLFKFYSKGRQPGGWVALENGGPENERNFIVEPNSRKRAYAPEDQARIWNNMVSPNPDHFSTGSSIAEFWRKGQNLFTRAILAWPAFHAMTVSLSAMSDRVALGLDNTIMAVARGEKAQWRKGAQQMVSAIGAPMTYYWQGRKLNRQFASIGQSYGPEFERIAELASNANFKTRNANVEWRTTGAGTFWQAVQRGALKKQLKAYGQEIASVALSPQAHKALPIISEVIGRAADSFFAPLWERYIPSLKMGSFYYNMRDFMERNPAATDAELKQAARRFADSADNRFGMLQADNSFWKDTTRAWMHMSLLSASWQTAYLREAGGAIGDVAKAIAKGDAKHLSNRVSYMLGATLVTAVTGGIATLMMTGKPPQSLKDYFWPRTGGQNQDGTEERIMLPGHEKDMAELYEIGASGFSPKTIAKVTSGKLNPFALWAYQSLMGEDFRGISLNPTDDTSSLISRFFENVLSNMEPIPLQQALAGQQKGSGLGVGADLLGMRKAPPFVNEPGLTEFREVNQRLTDAKRRFFSDQRRAHGLEDPHQMDAQLKRDRADIAEVIKQRAKALQKYNKEKQPEGGYQGTVAPQQ